MKKGQLVFIPAPIIGHFVSAVELAKLLVDRDERLSITVLVMETSLSPNIARSYIDSVISAWSRIRFVHMPDVELDPSLSGRFFISLIEAQKSHVKEEVSKLVLESESGSDSPRLAGFVLDMFFASIIDAVNEFGVPSYIFFTSAASFLGLTFHIQALHDEQKVDPTEFTNSDVELVVPCLASPFPVKLSPSSLFSKEWLPFFFRMIRRLREAKGIMVNTFYELESHALNSFSDGNFPPVYPVGPILSLNSHENHTRHKDIMQWLDHQPSSSVVYLCFGSMGSFSVEQVKEIACGLEQSGHRFLWSLRQPPPDGKMEAPSDYVNPEEVLPAGFLDRTSEIGKIIGWAPQVDILDHPSIGGFVSHCGWNSTLESIWFDVPMATWPMFAEQQFNAFLMVVEFGLAIEIKMNYRKAYNMDGCEIVRAEEIEKGIRGLMEIDREKLKEISEKSRKALMKDGSSYTCSARLIQDIIDNMA
ncbi:hypothetical protein OIU76_010731 [Salix suchowensis]|nr:anthocyanidin O-glucosyltransferase [Salix suchowensis]KAG5242339.1 anthocyanidin O-glucosyltransferase [Salix suchowensis]KAJ6332398.1 hypothetical protein OIU76_010731 [Salix suchowensis]